MTSLTFSIELAQQLLESDVAYPVSLEDAWVWLGYAKKQNAKDKLIRNFDKDLDYIITQSRVNLTQQDVQGGRPSENISLTIDCFKSLGMMSGTEQGKQIRQYFLHCEKVLKQIAQERQQKAQLPPMDVRVSNLVDAMDKMQRLCGSFNPYMQQEFKDLIGNMVTESNQKQLSASKEDWRGIVSLAEELGYKVPIKGDKCRTKLGKFVAAAAPELAQLKEKRLCNEVQQPIYVYPLHTTEVRSTLTNLVHSFFE